MCKIMGSEKMMWSIFMKSNKRNKSQQNFEFTYSIDIYFFDNIPIFFINDDDMGPYYND